jgi:serine/threonine protein kinase
MEEPDIRRMLKDITTALYDLHEYGMVHGDLKPDNIILARDGCGYNIIDFGSIRKMGVTTDMVFTYDYAAPEVRGVFGENISPDRQMDAYSLGMTLRECLLFGNIPRRGSKELEAIVEGLRKEDPRERLSIRTLYYMLSDVIEIAEPVVPSAPKPNGLLSTRDFRDSYVDALYDMSLKEDRLDAFALSVSILDRLDHCDGHKAVIRGAYILACVTLKTDDIRVEESSVRQSIMSIAHALKYDLRVETVDMQLVHKYGHPCVDYGVLREAVKDSKGCIDEAVRLYIGKRDFVFLE